MIIGDQLWDMMIGILRPESCIYICTHCPMSKKIFKVSYAFLSLTDSLLPFLYI
jgi:hypothetical protein